MFDRYCRRTIERVVWPLTRPKIIRIGAALGKGVPSLKFGLWLGVGVVAGFGGGGLKLWVGVGVGVVWPSPSQSVLALWFRSVLESGSWR